MFLKPILAAYFFLFATLLSANEILSGFIVMNPDGRGCKIVWGNNSENIECTPKIHEDSTTGNKTAYLRLDIKNLSLNMPPICVVSPVDVDNSKVYKLTVGTFTTNYVDIILNGESTHPKTAIGTIICNF